MTTTNRPNRYLKYVLTALCGVIFLISCGKDENPVVDCTGLTPTYTADIKAILDASCALSGCHDTGTQQAGIDLSNYTDAKTVSTQERFLGAINHKKGFEAMPQGSPKLSSDKINLITCWVQNGSPE
jgi:hypothetical protein